MAEMKLLPCPFCGGDNVKTFGPYGWHRQWGVGHSCASFYNGSQEMFKDFHSEADAVTAWNHRAASPAPSSQREIEAALEALESDAPEYHDSGMGCGLEDRNITDRYEAMAYGWDQAMERVYSENIAWAKDILRSCLAAPPHPIVAEGVRRALAQSVDVLDMISAAPGPFADDAAWERASAARQILPELRAALATLEAPAVEPGEAAHPDDLAVDRFAAAMKAKLAKKRDEGRGGWGRRDECSAEHLSDLLRDHVRKGDPLDVGNFAMMLHQRGERIASQEPVNPEPAKPLSAVAKARKQAEAELASLRETVRLRAKSRAAERAALAREAPAVEPGEALPRYRHVATRGIYEVIGIGKMQADGWFSDVDWSNGSGSEVDMREVVLYRNVEHGTLWVRPRTEFESGRFEVIP